MLRVTCVSTIAYVLFVGMPVSAQTPACQLEQAIPQKAERIDSTVLTANSSSWNKVFTAGQKTFVKITNSAPPHAVGVRVRFFSKLANGREKDDCIAQTLVFPRKTATYSFSVFQEKVTYRLEVSLVNDVDVAVANIDVFALRP